MLQKQQFYEKNILKKAEKHAIIWRNLRSEN